MIVCTSNYVYAQEYQISEIEEIAYAFFNQANSMTNRSNSQHKKIATIEAITRDNTDYMYLVNTVDSAGWVILSNEKRYPTIIAHADSGSLTYEEVLRTNPLSH